MKQTFTLLLLLCTLTAGAQSAPETRSRQPELWDMITVVARDTTATDSQWRAPLQQLVALPHHDYDNENIGLPADSPFYYTVTVDSRHGYMRLEAAVQMPLTLEMAYWKTQSGRRMVLINSFNTMEGPGGTEDPVVQSTVRSLTFELTPEGTPRVNRQPSVDAFFADIIRQHPDVEFRLPRKGKRIHAIYNVGDTPMTRYIVFSPQTETFR